MRTATAQLDGPWNRAKGDMNGDGEVDAFYSSPYSAALSDLASYHSTYPMLDGEARGDVNDDGSFDSFDTTPFGNLLSGSLALPYVSHAPTLQSRRNANDIALNDIGHQGDHCISSWECLMETIVTSQAHTPAILICCVLASLLIGCDPSSTGGKASQDTAALRTMPGHDAESRKNEGDASELSLMPFVDFSASETEAFFRHSLGRPEFISVSFSDATFHFVQTFPYSGVRASWVHVYRETSESPYAALIGLWRFPSVERMDVNPVHDGSRLEVRFKDTGMSIIISN